MKRVVWFNQCHHPWYLALGRWGLKYFISGRLSLYLFPLEVCLEVTSVISFPLRSSSL